MKKIIMLIGLIVIIGIGIFAFTGGSSDSSDVTTMLEEYESKIDDLIPKVKSGSLDAMTEYGAYIGEFSVRWAKALKEMDKSKKDEYIKLYDELQKKWEKAAN